MPEFKQFKFKSKISKPLDKAQESLDALKSEIESTLEKPTAENTTPVVEEKVDSPEPIGPVSTALAYANDLREAVINTYGGKKGHNPYVWIQNVLEPLINRIKSGDTVAIKDLMDIDPTTVKCSLDDLKLPYGKDMGYFANNPKAAMG